MTGFDPKSLPPNFLQPLPNPAATCAINSLLAIINQRFPDLNPEILKYSRLLRFLFRARTTDLTSSEGLVYYKTEVQTLYGALGDQHSVMELFFLAMGKLSENQNLGRLVDPSRMILQNTYICPTCTIEVNKQDPNFVLNYSIPAQHSGSISLTSMLAESSTWECNVCKNAAATGILSLSSCDRWVTIEIKRNSMNGYKSNPVDLRLRENATLQGLGKTALSTPLNLKLAVIHSMSTRDLPDVDSKWPGRGPVRKGH
jgi:hypothetical protein